MKHQIPIPDIKQVNVLSVEPGYDMQRMLRAHQRNIDHSLSRATVINKSN